MADNKSKPTPTQTPIPTAGGVVATQAKEQAAGQQAEEKRQRNRTIESDEEILAMSGIVKLLRPLPVPERRRVLRWAIEKYMGPPTIACPNVAGAVMIDAPTE